MRKKHERNIEKIVNLKTVMTNKEAYTLISLLLEMSTPPNTKLENARRQTLKNAGAFIESYNAKLSNLSIEYCSTDDRNNIIHDQRGERIFTKDNLRALMKETKQFLDSPVIIPFEIIATTDRKGLSDAQVEYLTDVGFIKE